MSMRRIYDYDLILARLAVDASTARVASSVGASNGTVKRVRDLAAGRQPKRRAMPSCRQRLAALGLDGREPARAARATALSARIRALRSEAHHGGALPWGPLQAAFAHEAGLTLDEIDEIYAVPPVEAVRAIATHAGR